MATYYDDLRNRLQVANSNAAQQAATMRTKGFGLGAPIKEQAPSLMDRMQTATSKAAPQAAQMRAGGFGGAQSAPQPMPQGQGLAQRLQSSGANAAQQAASMRAGGFTGNVTPPTPRPPMPDPWIDPNAPSGMFDKLGRGLKSAGGGLKNIAGGLKNMAVNMATDPITLGMTADQINQYLLNRDIASGNVGPSTGARMALSLGSRGPVMLAEKMSGGVNGPGPILTGMYDKAKSSVQSMFAPEKPETRQPPQLASRNPMNQSQGTAEINGKTYNVGPNNSVYGSNGSFVNGVHYKPDGTQVNVRQNQPASMESLANQRQAVEGQRPAQNLGQTSSKPFWIYRGTNATPAFPGGNAPSQEEIRNMAIRRNAEIGNPMGYEYYTDRYGNVQQMPTFLQGLVDSGLPQREMAAKERSLNLGEAKMNDMSLEDYKLQRLKALNEGGERMPGDDLLFPQRGEDVQTVKYQSADSLGEQVLERLPDGRWRPIQVDPGQQTPTPAEDEVATSKALKRQQEIVQELANQGLRAIGTKQNKNGTITYVVEDKSGNRQEVDYGD